MISLRSDLGRLNEKFTVEMEAVKEDMGVMKKNMDAMMVVLNEIRG